MANNHSELEKRLWDAADDLRANSKLKSAEYSVPVLGLIFLRYADHKFSEAEKKMPQQGSGRRKLGKTDYQAQGVLYLPEKARFGYLNLPEGADIGKAINEGMKAIETENEDLKDVLPKTCNTLDKSLLVSLLGALYVQSDQHQDSAKAQPTDLESTVVRASARCGMMQSSPTSRPIMSGFSVLVPDACQTKGTRIDEWFFTSRQVRDHRW